MVEPKIIKERFARYGNVRLTPRQKEKLAACEEYVDACLNRSSPGRYARQGYQWEIDLARIIGAYASDSDKLAFIVYDLYCAAGYIGCGLSCTRGKIMVYLALPDYKKKE